jgi:hypothetical protein
LTILYTSLSQSIFYCPTYFNSTMLLKNSIHWQSTGWVQSPHHIANILKTRSIRNINKWFVLLDRTQKSLMVVDCNANSDTAEHTQVENTKWHHCSKE